MGVSAGAFGVAFNCDAVAAKVKAKDPNAGDFKTFVDVDTNIDVDNFNYDADEAKVNSRILILNTGALLQLVDAITKQILGLSHIR